MVEVDEVRFERGNHSAKRSVRERMIAASMRLAGAAGLFALIPVFLPHSWMNAIHQYVGLGTLPNLPIVSYLTRSLSLQFALFGSLTLYIASDVRRHREFVVVWALMFVALGVVRIGIDVVSDMPLAWTLMEGPPVIVLGLMVLVLQHWRRPA